MKTVFRLRDGFFYAIKFMNDCILVNKAPNSLALYIKVINFITHVKRYGTFVLLLFVVLHSIAQAPSGIPYGKPEPLELNLTNIIFFFVIPILMIIFYIVRRRNKRE